VTNVKNISKYSPSMRSVSAALFIALRPGYLRIAGCALLAAGVGFSPFAFSQQGGEKTFASPGDAALALYSAVKSSDSQTLNQILGSNAGSLLHTGDDVADKTMAENFVRRYEQMHRVVVEPDQTATLYIGAENMGFNVVKGSCITALEPMSPKDQQKMERTIARHARRFHDQLLKPAYSSPSIFQLMIFRMARTSIRQMLGDGNRDHTYYRERGWFESGYYYPIRLGLLKSALGAAFDWMACRIFRAPREEAA
jgi:Protein of unknown function (DUF2950)